LKRALLVAIALLAVAFSAHAVPFWGAKSSKPADTDPAELQPGEFIWLGDAVPAGPIVVVVSISEQRADVYRNGVRIGVSTASTAKQGHRTPTGVFTVLQKDADHHSKTYQRRDALHRTTDLGWRRAARRWPARLPVVARLRPPTVRVRGAPVQGRPDGDDGGDRRRPQCAE
jgi:hypothetical protein